MSERSDRVARLVYLDGYTYKEAAAEIGIGLETVKSHLKAWRRENGLQWLGRREIFAWLRNGARAVSGGVDRG